MFAYAAKGHPGDVSMKLLDISRLLGTTNTTSSPSAIVLQSLPSRSLTLVTPIQLTIEETSDGIVMASNGFIGVFGIGKSIPDAITDFSDILVDLLHELEEDEDALSSRLKNQLDRIRELTKKQ